MSKDLNEDTHHPDILEQAGVSTPQGFKADATDGDGDGFVQDGTEWMRPVVGFKPDARDGDGDGFVQDGTKWERPAEPVAVAEEPVIEPVVAAVVVEEVVAAEEAPKPAAPAKRNKGKKVDAAAPAIPTELEEGTAVLLSKLVFESIGEHNSDSVRALQIRLIELGYITAGDDKQGWISAGTVEALTDYKTDINIEADSLYAEDLIKSLFTGTSVQVLP
jgi:hypothetical protein